MKYTFISCFIGYLIFSILMPVSVFANDPESMVIAVIGKTKNDSFYEQSFKGCQIFSKTHKGISCVYDGPSDYQDIRSQKDVVLSAIKKGVDGILISITNSSFLADQALNKAKEHNIPVITFDSDLLPDHQGLRLAYVGTDNLSYGLALGNYAKNFKQEGTTKICIQSGHQSTPNLNERIRGVRLALSGNSQNQKMQGGNDWTEEVRCPMYSQGKRKKSILQLKYVLTQQSPPIFLAVAGFAQFSPDYIKTTMPYQERIKSGSIVIISADTEAIQLKALKQNLSTANIGQRPVEMGRLGTQLLYDVIKNGKRPEKEFYHLDFHYCTAKNVNTCTQQ